MYWVFTGQKKEKREEFPENTTKRAGYRKLYRRYKRGNKTAGFAHLRHPKVTVHLPVATEKWNIHRGAAQATRPGMDQREPGNDNGSEAGISSSGPIRLLGNPPNAFLVTTNMPINMPM